MKWYADLYESFKRSIVFNDVILDKVYDAKCMKHFYSVEEIGSFRQQRSKRALKHWA